MVGADHSVRGRNAWASAVAPGLAALPSVDILGVRVHCTDTKILLSLTGQWITQLEPRTVVYVNAHCLNTAQTDLQYREILNRADLVYADGVAVAWASRWLRGCSMQRATGADWIEPFCALAQTNQWRIYVVAGAPGIANRGIDVLCARYPGLCVVGVTDGFFEARSEEDTLRDIVRTAPNVIFIGMGAPGQEKWLATHRHRLSASVCWTVGALFDYVAGAERRAPAWMRRLALEWCWRLLIDPVGKWRRYLLGNPRLVYGVLRQRRAMTRSGTPRV